MKPIIGMTMGDAAGIGPEIIAKALENPQVHRDCRPVVIGDFKIMKNAVKINRGKLHLRPVRDIRSASFEAGSMNIYDMNNIKPGGIIHGQVDAGLGRAAGEYIAKAVELALSAEIDAIVTAPINKESFYLGGYGKKFSGHTEMLAALTHTKEVFMLLAADNLRVIHVSTHLSLKKALEAVTENRIHATIKAAYSACRQLGIAAPKIAVAGLNPHGGEGGIMGEEEEKEIKPAVARAVAEGIDVQGPFPADTVFPRGLAGAYDMIVAQYHDQGHIPVKLHGFKWKGSGWSSVRGVNITIGLPIIRTSVDHGTAFGKAGQGKADEMSLLDALGYAIRLAENKPVRPGNVPKS